MYNLQILPDTLLMGSVLLAILLANPTVLTLATGVTGTQFIAHGMGALLMRAAPDSAVARTSLDACTGGFIGQSWNNLFYKGTEHLWHPLAPSVYMSTVGFFTGYGASLSQLYKEEIEAGMAPRSTLIASGVITAILVIITLAYRYSSGCESLFGAAAGLALGVALGYLGAVIIGYATDRRATNLWGIPLLRDRINNGSAVYICPKNQPTQ